MKSLKRIVLLVATVAMFSVFTAPAQARHYSQGGHHGHHSYYGRGHNYSYRAYRPHYAPTHYAPTHYAPMHYAPSYSFGYGGHGGSLHFGW